MFFSNLTILFNKWLIDNAGFRKSWSGQPKPPHSSSTNGPQAIVSSERSSHVLLPMTLTDGLSRGPDMVAHDVCSPGDSVACEGHVSTRRSPQCQHDPALVHQSRGSHWFSVQREHGLQ